MPDKVTTLSYRRVNWRNSNEGNTALSADNLNVMDKGISDAVSSINRIDVEVYNVNSDIDEITNRLDSVDIKTAANETAIENIQNTIDNFSHDVDGGEIE